MIYRIKILNDANLYLFKPGEVGQKEQHNHEEENEAAFGQQPRVKNAEIVAQFGQDLRRRLRR